MVESRIFTMTGVLDDERNTSLRIDLNPPIYLDPEKQYMLGVIGFETYNHIPNVTWKNNRFVYRKPDASLFHTITIPQGTYDAKDILKYLMDNMKSEEKTSARGNLQLVMNNNTSQTQLKCVYDVDFTFPNSIGSLLGFTGKLLKADRWHTSDDTIKIISVNSLVIMCNVVGGSYRHGKPAHILHQFFPIVPPGYKIVERPQSIIYLPLITNIINELIIEIEDEHGQPINFNGEAVTITLHLKSV